MMQEYCDYCGDGRMAVVRPGGAVLTDKRFMVLRKSEKATFIFVIPILIILAIVIAFNGTYNFSYVQVALIGAVIGGLAGLISAPISKMLNKNNKAAYDTVASFDHANITGIEDGRRGLRKMLVIKFDTDALIKIGVANKDDWRKAFSRFEIRG